MTSSATDWLSRCSGRAELLIELQLNEPPSKIVELGVATGLFSSEILASCPQAAVYLIDPWEWQPTGYNDTCNASQANYETNYATMLQNIAPWLGRGRAMIIKQLSYEAVSQFADGELDMVYVDANHSESAVRRDMRDWWPKLRPGGILAGHDYVPGDPNVVGVIPAVDAFVAEHGLELFLLNKTGDCSWAVRRQNA